MSLALLLSFGGQSQDQTAPSASCLYQENLDRIQQIISYVASRMGFSREDAEDFRSEVHIRLMEKDFRVLRKFRGECKFSTFLVTVITNQARDFRIKKWGKWKTSVAARRLGTLATEIEILLYRDGVPLREAIEVLIGKGLAESAEEVESLAERIPPRNPRRFSGESEAASRSAEGPDPQNHLLLKERLQRLNEIYQLLRKEVKLLEPSDLLLVRLYFFEGFKISTLAEQFGIEQRRLYTQKERIRRRLARRLGLRGVSEDEVRELLSDSEETPS